VLSFLHQIITNADREVLMLPDTAKLIQKIEPGHLEQVVSVLLGKKEIKLTGWKATPIYGGLDKNNALIRCQGVARSGAQNLPWSLVIKIISRVPDNDDPRGYQYWQREALFYRSGLADRLPGNLSAPRCYAVDEDADQTTWIWMEDARDDFAAAWPFELHGRVAYQLGLFNGAYLAGTPFPSEDWLAQNFLRNYVERASPMIDFIRTHPHHKLVRSLYGKNLPLILACWQVRGDLLDVLERMPQTFCHQDAFKRNLFYQHDRLIAIDWGFCGNAPAGCELVPLVAVALSFGDIPFDQARTFERLCLDSYQKGLADAGAHVPARSVRRCYVLGVLLRYVFGGNIGDVLPALLDEERHTWMEKGYGQTVEEISKTSQAESNYYLSIFLRALALMGIKPLLKIIACTLWYSLPGRQPAPPDSKTP
jgi:hypothetical protein